MVSLLLRRLRCKATAFSISFLAACLLFTAGAQSPDVTGVASIRMEELREKLTYIASEKFKGRGNGTPGLQMAAEYIAGVFAKNGLKPAGKDGSYYQVFDMYTSRLGSSNKLRINDSNLKLETDFIPERWSANASVTGFVTVVDAPLSQLPDLTGKIAVIAEDQYETDDPEFPLNASTARKLQAAGATALVVAQRLGDRNGTRISALAENFRDDLAPRYTAMGTDDDPDYPNIPVIVVSSEAGRQLTLNAQVKLSVDVERKKFKTQNIIGLIEGRDSARRNEVMIVGAHYDHDGEADGQIWYGADDNGSGTSALLELAEAFGNGSPRPARSILLCAWVGEEKGLLGSRYYASHPVFPLDETIAMFQMDMIGRNEEHAGNKADGVSAERAADNINSLNVLGSAFSPDLKAVISRLNTQTGLIVRFRYDFGAEDLVRRSDQWSFLSKGIPAVFFFTGLHPDYHTPRDTAAKINFPKLEKITKLVYLSAYELANDEGRPGYTKPK